MPENFNPELNGHRSPPGVEDDLDTGTSHVARLKRIGMYAIAVASTAVAMLTFEAVSPDIAQAETPVPMPNVSTMLETAPGIYAPPAPRVVPFERGVAVYNWSGDGGPRMYGNMQALHLTGARLSLVRSNSAFDLAQVQQEVPVAQAHGVDVAVNFGDPPSVSRAGFPQWAARTIAELPGVDRVIPENEVNNPSKKAFYGFPMRTYVDELYKTTQAIHAVRPDVKVCGFGLDSIEADDPVGYLQRAALYAYDKYGGLQNIEDCLSVHFYLSPQKDEALIQDYETLTVQPIYVDEFGRNVANGISLTQQAAQTAQFMAWSANQPQVWGVNNYRLRNSPADPFKTGLMSPEGGLLPVARVLKALPVDR